MSLDLSLERLAMRHIRSIHLVGIGGAGMAGIAEVLFHQGYAITGSDLQENHLTARLSALGAHIFSGHRAQYVEGADVVVVSSAINEQNPELVRAHELHIPVIPRAKMLAEIMRFRYGIAVAGSHGKTTTTSLIAHVLAACGFDPTFVIGGQFNQVAGHAYLGNSRYLIAEADESDASFLYLHPMLSVVTNLDADHLTTYQGSIDKLKSAFLQFLHHLPFYGLAIIGIDDPLLKSIIPDINRRLITFGFDEQAKIRAIHLRQQGAKTHFDVLFGGQTYPAISPLPGKHNVLNVLASIAVAYAEGIPVAKAIKQLPTFSGINRRFDVLGETKLANTDKNVTVIDDYGHHPREIAAMIETVRDGWSEKRLVMAFQPHRYTRTRDLFDEFVHVLQTVDELILLDVYAASETPIEHADSHALALAIAQKSHLRPQVVKTTATLYAMLPDVLQDNDIFLIQGAGNIGELATYFKPATLKKEKTN